MLAVGSTRRSDQLSGALVHAAAIAAVTVAADRRVSGPLGREATDDRQGRDVAVLVVGHRSLPIRGCSKRSSGPHRTAATPVDQRCRSVRLDIRSAETLRSRAPARTPMAWIRPSRAQARRASLAGRRRPMTRLVRLRRGTDAARCAGSSAACPIRPRHASPRSAPSPTDWTARFVLTELHAAGGSVTAVQLAGRCFMPVDQVAAALLDLKRAELVARRGRRWRASERAPRRRRPRPRARAPPRATTAE